KHNISEITFNKILKALEISEISLFKLHKLLKDIVSLKLILINYCINSCVAFTNCAKTFSYQHNYTSTYEYTIGNQIEDIFDGYHYKNLVSSEFFSDHQDIALIASTDGYQNFH
ncbi:7218_t:CDS:2, partial [Funneliformis caledonium]